LAHNEINRIVRDSRGFLWFCTAGGLSRFDGYSFTNFGADQGLGHANVSDLLETRNGEYWVATNDGLFRFNPKGAAGEKNEGAMFSVVVPDTQADPAIPINVLLEDHSGAIWCGTRQGLFRLIQTSGGVRLRSVEIGIPPDYALQRFVADVVEDKYGSLWIATPSGLYRRWPDGSAARYTERDGLPNDFLSDIYLDHKGNLWVASLLGGFFNLLTNDSHKAPVVGAQYSLKRGLPTNWIFNLSETSDHRFWIGTNVGLIEFFPNGDNQGRLFHSYSTRNGLSYQGITTLAEDVGGNLWLGTNTTGAMKLSRSGFITYDDRDGLQAVNSIFNDRSGRVCFKGAVLGDDRMSVFEGGKLDLLRRNPPTSYQRFGCFDGERFTWFKPIAFSNFGWVMEDVTLQTANREWWVGSGVGLYRFPPVDSFESIKTATPLAIYSHKDGLEPEVFRLFEDSQANLWISTITSASNQLIRWKRATDTMEDLSDVPGLPSARNNLPRSFGEDRSRNVWIGYNKGLARYSNGRFRLFTVDDGLPPGAIMNILLDQSGRLWLASALSGLVRIDDPSAEHPEFVNYTTSEGLSSNNVLVVVDDLAGRIYAGGGHGLDVLDPARGGIKHFTTVDGLASGLFRGAFRDKEGSLWFGMTNGLSKLVSSTRDQIPPAPVMISGLRVAGAPRPVSALAETAIALEDLSANANQLQIDFIAISFAVGEVLRYQYKLDGADTDWSAPSELRTVNYANLGPGKYEFLVRAINSDGTASTKPASLTFTILRPLWQRWWFIALVSVALVTLVFSAYRYRVSRLLQMANLRTRIATDLHDDIGANLTRISMLSEVAKQNFGENGSEDSPLMSISRIARESVGSMSDIVWAIDPERDTLLDLTRKMRRHADEVFTLRDIELNFNAPNAKDSLHLGVDIRRDLLLIFKEAVNNAARHSGCTQVNIDLLIQPTHLLLEITDNGTGFDQSMESEGHGLRSMKRRAKALGGTLEITSSRGVKTVVRIRTPIGRSRSAS
jgi:signal transduction histidine kinase/ligand-binding sensor domain-containing protein